MGYCCFCLVHIRCKDFKKIEIKQFNLYDNCLIAAIKYMQHCKSERYISTHLVPKLPPRKFSLQSYSKTFLAEVSWMKTSINLLGISSNSYKLHREYY